MDVSVPWVLIVYLKSNNMGIDKWNNLLTLTQSPLSLHFALVEGRCALHKLTKRHVPCVQHPLVYVGLRALQCEVLLLPMVRSTLPG